MTRFSNCLLSCSRLQRPAAIWSGGTRSITTASIAGREEIHNVSPEQDELDQYLNRLVRTIPRCEAASVHDLYSQYQNEAGLVLGRVVPYEERPAVTKRADRLLHSPAEACGDGIVLVVHGQLDESGSQLLKTTVCSGFVVNASISDSKQGDNIVTCAHTLEEVSSTSALVVT